MKLKRSIWCLAAAALTVAVVHGQTVPVQAPARDSASALASSGPVKGIFRSGAKRAEERLIPMVIKRVDLSGDARTRLEVQLDMQVLSRWIASIKPANDDHAAVLFLRLQQLNALAGNLQDQFASEGKADLNRVQQDGARQLHQLTFDLPATADAPKIDEVCRNVAIFAMDISSGVTTNPSSIPSMRPTSLPPAPADQATRAQPRAAGPGRSDPARLIPNLSVSQPLRQQLLATLDMIERPGSNDMTEQDVAQLRPVLDEAIDVAAGLAGNAGVTAEDRDKLERQLTESLALFGDRRLRDLAKQRIAEMSRYRMVLGSITRLRLSEANYKTLAPAFEYAQKNPDVSKEVLTSLERFVGYCTTFDKSPATLTYAANPALAKSIQRPYDDSRKAFDTGRSGFLTDVEGLGSDAITGSDPDDLVQRLDEMRLALDLIDALQAMPQALDTFAAFKPKPAGGLERRIAREASVAASPGKGPIRQEAADVLKDLIRLAETARDLEALKIEGPELQIFTAYTKKTPEEIDAKWRSNVTEVISQAASGGAIDSKRIERNENLIPLVQSLSGVVQVEAQAKQAAKLQRWADWGVDPKAVEHVLLPYRAAAAGAFTGFLSDSTDAMQAWPAAQKERRPIMNFVMRSIGGASMLPDLAPLQQNCAKLMTPLADNGFAVQRYFALATAALSAADADTATSEDIRKALAIRLRNQ